MTFDGGMAACQTDGGVLAILDSIELFDAAVVIIHAHRYKESKYVHIRNFVCNPLLLQGRLLPTVRWT